VNGLLEISAKEVQAMQGDGGIPFREFMKQVLQAHAFAVGIPCADVISDSENMADGGCDTEVRTSASTDKTAYAIVPSCWQFKGTEKERVTDTMMRDEVNKPYARKLIESGYGYKLAIADDFPAQEAERREKVLASEIAKINPSAPAPRVLSATMISKLAGLYPALVLARRGIKGFQTMATWHANVTKDTKIFVPNAGWSGVENVLRQHLDFSFEASEPCMRVRGDAGVGKTRCVFETVNSIEGAHQLCLYTNDETAARGLAVDLANNVETKAIIIADESLNRTRQHLDEVLGGAKDRVRVVVINNTDEPSREQGPEPIVQKLSNEMMDKILEQNFQATPAEQRRAAIDLAEGFVRIAADLCKHGVEKGMRELGTYFDLRVPDESRRRAVEAISLFERVGWKGEVGNQLEIVASLVGMTAQELREACLAAKDASPGFIVLAGRYFYVTPAAIARVCFPRAWQRWVEPDIQRFHSDLVPELAESFQLRLQKSAPPEIRDAFAKTMESAVSQFRPEDLSDKKKAEELIRLVETHPSKFLPRLRQLVESAPAELLSTGQPKAGGWGFRRKVVWTCEHLAAFPEYFYDIERILLKLAIHETEFQISNNASAIWQQLYRIHLSGTSVPFPDRVVLLRKRIGDANTIVALLAVGALESAFAGHLTRSGGPAVVAGMIPPEEWQPASQSEVADCFKTSLHLLDQALDDPREAISRRAAGLIVENIRFLLSHGSLEFVVRFTSRAEFRRDFTPKILDQIADFETFDAKGYDPNYLAQLQQWQQSLIPRNDKIGFLRSVVGRARRWSEDPSEERKLDQAISELASRLLNDHEFFDQSVEWLSSDEANYAFELGEKLGEIDSQLTLFDSIKSRAESDSASFVRGYIHGLALGGRVPESITQWLNELESSQPLILYRIASTVPREVDGLARVLRLVKNQQLPPRFLNGFQHRFRGEGISELQLGEIFDVLVACRGDTRQEALATAIDIASSQIDGNNPQPTGILFGEQVWPRLSHIIRDAMPRATMDVFHWSRVLKAALDKDPDLVTKKAVEALCEGIYVGQQANSVLSKVIEKSPQVVMDELGNALLNEKNGWRLQLYGFKSILVKLPRDVVIAWLDQHGASGARKLASNLPQPFVSESGDAVVPEITQTVLARYGSDEEVIKRFVLRSGVRSYSGDIVGRHLQEAEVASRFLNHPIEAVRRWAQSEREMALAEANRWKQQIEEERW
jgi:hypothetical protein